MISKKQFIYLCAAKANDQTKYCKFVIRHKESINFSNPQETIKKMSLLFKNKHGIEPTIVEGPFIEHKGSADVLDSFYLVIVNNTDIIASRIVEDSIADYRNNGSLIFGPCTEININKTKENKIDRDLSEIILSNKQQRAEFNNWVGIANYIENDAENILFIFLQPKDNLGKKKNIPQPGKINLSNIKLISQ
jgi:hypothetical protein